MDKVRGVRDGLSDRIPQQHKDTAHNHLNRGKQFLTEEYFPEERRDQFIYRGKKVILFFFFFDASSLLIFLLSPRSSSSVRSTTIIKSPSNGFYLMLRSTPVMGRRLLDTARRVMPLSLP
jgi:Family of unknown function (DUF5923)